jgi:hypothetical protein
MSKFWKRVLGKKISVLRLKKSYDQNEGCNWEKIATSYSCLSN